MIPDLQREYELFLPRFLENSFYEDVRTGDHTTLATVPAQQQGRARLLVKDDGILAGVELAQRIFEYYDAHLGLDVIIGDGKKVHKGDIAFIVEGSLRSIIICERLVLNCMQRMSGIATQTRSYASLIEDLPAKLLDTRKTTPGIRFLEKWAVLIGGGRNHRFGLYDMIMLKDNHVDSAGGIEAAINAVAEYQKQHNLNLKVEVETRSLKEVEEVLRIGKVHRIMLDNFTPALVKEAVELIAGRYETEASGGITAETLRTYAETGVDFISSGALTHSAKSLDMSLKIEK